MKTGDITLTALKFGDVAAKNAPSFAAFKHFPALDGLRGIAILLVMLYHLEFLIPELHEWVKGGFLGVDVFFVLSGFLITSVLLKEYDQTQSISLKRFYLRRFFRLMPAYWLFLLTLYFFSAYILPKHAADLLYTNNNFLYAFLYLLNWHRAIGDDGITGNLNHTWSLSIEEQFYIFWSLFLYFAFSEKRNRKQITAITAVLLIALIVMRAVRAFFGTGVSVLYYSTDSRMDALLFGCLASMIFNWRIGTDFLKSKVFSCIAAASVLTATIILMSVTYKEMYMYYSVLSVFAAAIAVMILWLVTNEGGKICRLLEFGFLTWIGQISYGLYLWHYAFYEFAKKSVDSPWLQSILGIVLAFSTAALSFYLLEQPFLKLKDALTGFKQKAGQM